MMKPRFSVNTVMYTGMIAVTLAAVGFRAYGAERQVKMASDLPMGAALPELELKTLEGARADVPHGQCRVLVAFAASCRHCHSAAARMAGQAAALPVVWISHTRDDEARGFSAEAAPNRVLFGGPAAFEKLRVNGVPTAFLVSASDTVRSIWVLQGDEDLRAMRSECGR